MAKDGRVQHALYFAHRAQRHRDVIAGHVQPPRSWRADLRHLFQFVGLAADDQLRVVNVADVRAAFRFVHVMSGDEKRHPLAGELEKQIPQLAPRDRIDTGRRFVEKQHRRFVHERARHRQALSPAAGKESRAAIEVRLEMRDRDKIVAAPFQFAVGKAVKFAGENEVLVHGQLVVEGKFLRHVTDHLLGRLAFACDIVPRDASGAFGRFEDAAKHPNHGGFAGAVRAEEPEDRTARHGKADVIDRGEIPEALRQPFAFDHRVYFFCHVERSETSLTICGPWRWESEMIRDPSLRSG